MGLLNGAVEGQLFRERGISGAWRSGSRKAVRAEDTGHAANGLLKHCLPLKTLIPNFVAFFVLL